MGDEPSILNSKLATKVLRKVAREEGGNYGSKIADQLDRSQASIGRVLAELNELGVLQKGKRQRAQYYEINYDFIGHYWFENIYEGLKNSDKDFNNKKWLEEGFTSKEEVLEGLEDNKKEIEDLVSNYTKEVLESDKNIDNFTLSELLFESFAYSIGHNMIENEEFVDKYPFLEYPKEAMVHMLNVVGFPDKLRDAI